MSKCLYIKEHEVLIDDEDYELISNYTWMITKGYNTYYAYAYVKGCEKEEYVYIHRLIKGVSKISYKDIEIDHKDGNGLNNQKKNLQFITKSGNQRKRNQYNKTGFTGVNKKVFKNQDKFQAKIRINGEDKYLGIFNTPEEAHKRYKEAFDRQMEKEIFDKILVVTIGLPRSGKSTWCLSTENPITCRDSIRWAIGGNIRYFKEEEKVSEIEKIMTKALFYAGHDIVIIDATHLKKKYIDAWEIFASEITDFKCKVILMKFYTPLEECVERAQRNFPEDANFPAVIRSMWENAETIDVPEFGDSG